MRDDQTITCLLRSISTWLKRRKRRGRLNQSRDAGCDTLANWPRVVCTENIDFSLPATPKAEISGLNRHPSFWFIVDVQSSADLYHPAVIEVDFTIVKGILPLPFESNSPTIEVTAQSFHPAVGVIGVFP